MRSLILAISTVLFLLFFRLATALAEPDTTTRLDQLFSSAIIPEGPGCNVGVLQDGEWLLRAGYGQANLELGVPLDGSQVHRMASVSKQFTAMAVLLLADEGQIDLNADIRSYLPALTDYGTPVTVKAMLGHTSGMGDYDLIGGSYEGPASSDSLDLRSVMGGPIRIGNEDYLSIDEFYRVVQQVPLAQTPGESFRYSNLAYFLLSMLVEEVSGASLRDYAQQRIFEPLGMRHTFFSDDAVEIVKQRAYGYKTLESGRVVNDMTNLFWVGDGGLHTNLDDLRLWDQHFYKPQLGQDPEAFMALMNSPNSELPARNGRYANGQFVGERHGRQMFSHSGGWLGTSTYLARIPAIRTSLMLMCNDANRDVQPLIKAALDIVDPPMN